MLFDDEPATTTVLRIIAEEIDAKAASEESAPRDHGNTGENAAVHVRCHWRARRLYLAAKLGRQVNNDIPVMDCSGQEDSLTGYHRRARTG